MNHRYKEIFDSIDATETNHICEIVIHRIHDAERTSDQRRLTIHGIIAGGAFLAVFPTVGYIARTAIDSGFSDYVSLIISDGGALLNNWRELGMSIVDSMPIMGGTIFVGVALVFTYSVRGILKYRSFLQPQSLHGLELAA